VNAPVALFVSAYRQLRPAERAYVDGYVADLERDAQRKGERISNALHRAVPAAIIEASRGMLDRPLVRAAIAERINDLAAQSELTVHRVVKELMNIGFSSIGHYQTIGEDGMPYYDLSQCTPEQLAAIQAIELETIEGRNGTTRRLKIKLHDKLGGLDRLARFMGMLENDNPHWRAEQARPIDSVPTLPADAAANDAAEAYAAMINS
jgi:hypothetical protein